MRISFKRKDSRYLFEEISWMSLDRELGFFKIAFKDGESLTHADFTESEKKRNIVFLTNLYEDIIQNMNEGVAVLELSYNDCYGWNHGKRERYEKTPNIYD